VGDWRVDTVHHHRDGRLADARKEERRGAPAVSGERWILIGSDSHP